MVNSQIKRSMAAIVGDERVSTSQAVREAHGRDESYHAPAAPVAVVFCESTEEVSAVLKLCDRHNIPVIPFGEGTSLEGHVAALQGGVSIDLSNMNTIKAVRPDDLDCTVEAGVRRKQLNEYLRDTGLFFPIDPGADASIGGMAACAASGTNAVKYGTMRENVLDLKVVLADGRVINTRNRAKKSAAGYDLTRLMIGSEGTLGIITEITLRLFGVPERIASAVVGFDSLDGAVRTVIETIQSGVPIARIELLDEVQIRAVNDFSRTAYAEKPTLFLEFHGSEKGVADQIETVEALCAANGGGGFAWALKAEERNRLWQARHDAAYAAQNMKAGGRILVTDVCVPISNLAKAILETRKDIDASSLMGPIVGHVGDGNFHVCIVVDPDKPGEIEEAQALNDRIVRRALKLEGTCTGEHGIGYGKMEFLKEELGQDAVSVMAAIKKALDPKNILNPGKIVRVDEAGTPS